LRKKSCRRFREVFSLGWLLAMCEYLRTCYRELSRVSHAGAHLEEPAETRLALPHEVPLRWARQLRHRLRHSLTAFTCQLLSVKLNIP
jgi:hypothetical protein